MKKFKGVAASIAAAVALTTAMASVTAGTASAGYANNDGKYDITDVVMVQKYLTNNGEADINYADVNKDGKVNVFDLVQLKRIVINGQTVPVIPTEPTTEVTQPTTEECCDIIKL